MVEQSSGDWHEHAVLVTSWEQSDLRVSAQTYRDRADAENMFDELKTHRPPLGGWTGYTTKDLKRSQWIARLVALALNWRRIYTRMGTGEKHREASPSKSTERRRNLTGRERWHLRDNYQFQWWAVSLVNAVPFGGKKKDADSGIDGLIYF